MTFRLPAGDQRLTVIGRTGSGKTTFAAWVLSRARLDARPWIIIDFKGEALFDEASPPVSVMRLDGWMPKKGVWRAFADPGEEDALESLLWRIWERENVGVFVDEAMNMPPRSPAFSAILRQGRSKRLPVIACTQRPVGCIREVFSEADYFAVFGVLNDPDDRRRVSGFCPIPWQEGDTLPRHGCWWFDVSRNKMLTLPAISDRAGIPKRLRQRAPDAPRFWW